jgi:hypothetical protein
VMGLPATVLAKPHWGLMARRSSGTTFAASSMRRQSAAMLSSFGVFVETRPSGNYGDSAVN